MSLNGRPGVVVSGGHSRQETNVSSVEFYDARTGGWFSLPSLNTGRAGHVMTVTEGKLMVRAVYLWAIGIHVFCIAGRWW